MKNIYSYIIALPIILLALIPAIVFKIPMPKVGIWFWYVLIAGFLGFYTLFLKTNIFVKIIAIGSFLNCFFSSAPYFSFTAYISLVLCCYFYILCSKIKNWEIIFNVIKAIMFLNILILSMQFLGEDSLLRFGVPGTLGTGVLGNTMQTGSVITVLSSLLITVNPLYIIFLIIASKICLSAGALLSVFVGSFIYLFNRCCKVFDKKVCFGIGVSVILLFLIYAHSAGEIKQFESSGRTPVWIKSIQLTNDCPIVGYGIGTFKHLFHPLSLRPGEAFRTAHNFLIQILFETGYPGLLVILSLLSCLSYKLIKTKNILCLAGLAMLVTSGLVHFPDRCIQTVPLIIIFLAYCEFKIKEKNGLTSCDY